MFFNEFEKYKDAEFDKRLLWEFKVDENFEWENMKNLVVKRTIELGKKEDYYAVFNMYGGIDNVKNIIKNIEFLNRKDMNFVSVVFGIKLEELKCYTKMLSMKKPIFY